MKPYLQVVSRGRDERFDLESDVVRIGRASDNELSVPDLSLSREHAEVRRHDAGYALRDLGSRNGTYLNDTRLSGEAELRDGDVIRLGETAITYHDDASGVRLSDRKEEKLSDGTVAIPAAQLISGSALGTAVADGQLVEALSQASRILIAKVDAAEVADRVLDLAMEAVGAERGALMLLEGEPPQLVARASRIKQGDAAVVLSHTIARTAIDEGRSIISTDARVDPRFDGAQSISFQGIRSAMCSPLWNEDRVSGLLYVDRRLSARQFSETDLALLTVLSNLTAAKLENLELLEEALAKRKLEEELALASEIQRKLLPAADPTIAGWEFAATSIPSRSVGGDLYDYIEKGRRVGLVVGDVSGKGVSAALLMASLQANLRAFASSGDDLAAIMSAVNEALSRSSTSNKFATVLYAELEPETGSVEYVNGGHNPGLLVRAATGNIERLVVGGMIVGAFAEVAEYQVGKAALEPGDQLVLYSDGVTEAERADGQMFGDERLERAVDVLRDGSAAALRDGLLEEIHAFTGGRPPTDDTTILVARRTPQNA